MQHLQPNTTLQGGKYRIERVLGQGGFGITYLARNTVFDINVAIKEFFMKDENERDGCSVTMPNSTKTDLFVGQMEKFKKEAKRMFSIKNEHIIGVHDLFEENGTAYYVMDYVDGENLAQRMKRTGKPLSEQEVRDILPQVLDALKSVHDAGIWHLDLKPANILIDKSGNVKLIDFGASKQMDVQKGGATTSTAISYTNGYAPREQMEQNYDKFGPWTDIYALGATLYNLLTNKRPPLPSDIDDDETEDKHQALPLPVEISDNMKALVLKLLKTNRKLRPQGIDEVLPLLDSEPDKTEIPAKKPVETKVEEPEDSEVTIISSDYSEKLRVGYNTLDNAMVRHDSFSSQSSQVAPPASTNNRDKASSKSLVTFIKYFAGAVLVLLFFVWGYWGRINNNQEEKATEESNVLNSPTNKETTRNKSSLFGGNYVKQMPVNTAIGKCKYTGFTDDDKKPNTQKGEAFFEDGSYFSGGFEHGVLTGKNCYFKYANGDVFEGEFRANSFYFGTFSVASDKRVFKGSFYEGKPYVGTWYDESGNVLEYIN